MIKIAIGFVLGVAVATVGVSGLSKMADNGVGIVQEKAKEMAK